MNTSQSLFERAKRVTPGGVNSPVRAFGSVGGTPVYVEKGEGAHITTCEGKTLLDFCGSWGPLLLGHANPAVIDAVCETARKGTTFGTNTEGEVLFAEALCEAVPCIDQVRLVNSGTEATMTALRLARGYTGRNKILKFDGCYHGHADYLLVSAGSGLLTNGIASSQGVSPRATEDVLVAPYNDPDALEKIVAQYGDELAAIIVEPIAGNMGLVEPDDAFLKALRTTTIKCGALLIFDEVITGFRVGPTSYGTISGINPDLTCMGKIIGGGLPMGAVGGREDIMQCLSPCGSVYQAGTLSGNPLAVAAGLAMLKQITQEPPYTCMNELTQMLVKGVREVAENNGRQICINAKGPMFTIFFQEGPVRDLQGAKRSDTRAHAKFFHGMLERGIYLPPSQFEVTFVSAAHTKDHVEQFISAADEVLAQ